MKIAFFHELPRGGAKQVVLEFGKEIRKKHEIDLYYINEKIEDDLGEIFSLVKFYKFIPRFWKGNDWKTKLYKDTIELCRLYKIHKKIAKEIDRKNYDFIFVHGSRYTQAPFVLRFLKTKSVYYCQEPLRMVYEELFDIQKNLNFGKKIYERFNRNNRRIIDKSNAKKTNLLLANSNFSKKNIKKFLEQDSKVAYLGFDPKIFFPEKQNKIYDILYIGSKTQVDGYFLLKDALKIMKIKPKVKWHISEANWLKDSSEVRSLYSNSKILVCLAYQEPFGLLPVEAQACGTVVVAVDDGGYKESVDNSIGRVIKRNKSDLSDALSELIINPNRLNLLSKKAIHKMNEHWTWEKRSESLLKLINDELRLS